MALNVQAVQEMPKLKSAHLGTIPEFNGEAELLPRFISTCEDLVIYFYNRDNPNDFQNKFLMNSILSKIKGNAQINLSSNIINCWADLKTALINAYSDKRDVLTLTIEMCSLRQNNNTPFEFYNRIQNLINLQTSYIITHNTANGQEIRTFLSELGLRTLLRGLNDPLGSLLRVRNPENLNQALNMNVNEFQIDVTKTETRNLTQHSEQYEPQYNDPTHNLRRKLSYNQQNRNYTQDHPHRSLWLLDNNRKHYLNKKPVQRLGSSKQYTQRPHSFQSRNNVWNRPPIGVPLPRPLPMSEVSRNMENTNLNLTEQNEHIDYVENFPVNFDGINPESCEYSHYSEQGQPECEDNFLQKDVGNIFHLNLLNTYRDSLPYIILPEYDLKALLDTDDTIQAGQTLLYMLSESKKERWCNLVESLDMKQNSRRAWKLVNNLNQESPISRDLTGSVTPDQIAHQLLLNGKTNKKPPNINIRKHEENENHMLDVPFTLSELLLAVKEMKNNKAAGPDDVRTEQIKRFGPATNQWIVDLFNNIMNSMRLPKLWRKSHVIALLKPGKEPTEPKNYRPISLLCHLFKVMERMVLNRILPEIDEKLIPQQSGFRPGRSCCGQILNLTQHIEDGFERKQVSGVALVDLTAAYDTVNHKRLVSKIYQTTKDAKLTNFIRCILQNRKFYVSLQNKNSRWRTQKNGLAQGSVLAPLLFNIYTNDQPIHEETKQFIYADDTAIAAQGKSFEEVEGKLTRALEKLSVYYGKNLLKPNPSKTQVCAFHLNNFEAKRKLKVVWSGQELEHCYNPKYLGVTLDRTLTYKKHCQNTKMKVSARNNIIRKLTGTSWGAQPHVLRTSAIALSLSAAEYAAPVWKSSAHCKQVDVAVNEAARIITGCLKPTPIHKIYALAGIVPPEIRRRVAAEAERNKQMSDNRHPLYGHTVQPVRLKSRKSFLQTTYQLNVPPAERKKTLWDQQIQHPLLELKEELPTGANQPFTTWKTLNRLRSGVSCCKHNMKKWGYEEDSTCECGEEQTEEHLLGCSELEETCTLDDLLQANDKALHVSNHWKRKI
ncbi:hypothetical protein WDU94_001908 [Cyamophila willieti]